MHRDILFWLLLPKRVIVSTGWYLYREVRSVLKSRLQVDILR